MPYAMVPVPEEDVVAVMQFIARAVARTSSGQPWDGESIAEVWDHVDDSCRAMLVHLARAAIAGGDQLAAEEVARRIGASIRETAAIVHELNSFARDGLRPNLITAPVAAEQLPDGTFTEKRIFLMTLEVADLVQEVAAGFVIADA